MSDAARVEMEFAIRELRRFLDDVDKVKRETDSIGDAADRAERKGSRAFGRFTSSAGRFAGRVTRFGGIAAAGLAVGFGVGLAAVLKTGTSELIEQEKVTAQTAATIKSTGGIARQSVKNIEARAASLQAMSGIEDDVIQSGENMLLTFKNIRGQTFDAATKSALDLSVAMHGDVVGASKLVGKALNDPIRGMSALNKYGVTFNEQQKERIKQYVEEGKRGKAQALILREINSQVGGSAKAYGNTTAGRIARLNRAWEELASTLARPMIPLLFLITNTLNRYVLPAGNRLAKLISYHLWPVIEGLEPVTRRVVEALIGYWRRLFGSVDEGVGGFARAGDQVRNFAADLLPILRDLWRNASTFVIAFVGDVIGLFRRLAPIVGPLIREVGLVVIEVVRLISAVWDRWGDEIMFVVETTFRQVSSILLPALRLIRSVIQTVTALIRGDWSGAWEGVKGILRNAWALIVAIIRVQITRALTMARAIGRNIVNGVRAGVSGLGSLASFLYAKISGAIGNLVERAKGAAAAIGRAIVDGIVEAVKSAPGAITDAINSIIPSPLRSAVDTALGALPGGPVLQSVLPHEANGGIATRSGWSVVGERGPELAYQPRGAVVAPLPAIEVAPVNLEGISGGGDGPIVVHAHTYVDGRRVAETVETHRRRRERRS